MKIKIQNLLLVLTVFAIAQRTMAQGTAFTYQARLSDGGSAASGNYDLKFTIRSIPQAGTKRRWNVFVTAPQGAGEKTNKTIPTRS